MTRGAPVAGFTVAAALLACCCVWLCATSARAHPLAPSSLRLQAAADGTVAVVWRTPSVRPRGSELVPRLPEHCRPTTAVAGRMTPDRAAFEQRWTMDCGEFGLVGSTLRVSGLSGASTNVVVEVSLPDGSSARGLLHRGDAAFVIPEGQGAGSVFIDYLMLGVEHLWSGPDHILFVVGLLILLGWRRKLVGAVTAFTLGHSVSLCLSALGVVRVPQTPIEVAIAVTLVVVALDILGNREGQTEQKRGPVARWPWLVCAAFGLLHGLGFAGALSHAGLPPQAVPLSLFGFNVGIEVGQLALVAVAAGLWFVLRRWLPPQRRVATVVLPAYIIGSLAAFWVLQRTLGGFGVL